jgi:hypothetical protein
MKSHGSSFQNCIHTATESDFESWFFSDFEQGLRVRCLQELSRSWWSDARRSNQLQFARELNLRAQHAAPWSASGIFLQYLGLQLAQVHTRSFAAGQACECARAT